MFNHLTLSSKCRQVVREIVAGFFDLNEDQQKKLLEQPGVYLICNRYNGKVYVGSGATGVKRRFWWRRSLLRYNKHANLHLQNSWNRHSESAFFFVVIETTTPTECLVREQYWMDLLESAKRSQGYNICPRAGNSLGAKLPPMSDARKKQVSEVSKKCWQQEEYRKQCLAGQRKRWAEPGAKEKHDQQMKERWAKDSEREAMSQRMQEAWQDEEYRAKIIRNSQKVWKNPALREQMIAGITKANSTPEAKKRSSEGSLKNWQNPEYRAKVIASRKKRWADPEHRAKRAANATKRKTEAVAKEQVNGLFG